MACCRANFTFTSLLYSLRVLPRTLCHNSHRCLLRTSGQLFGSEFFTEHSDGGSSLLRTTHKYFASCHLWPRRSTGYSVPLLEQAVCLHSRDTQHATTTSSYLVFSFDAQLSATLRARCTCFPSALFLIEQLMHSQPYVYRLLRRHSIKYRPDKRLSLFK
jgi:hypothetical protein